jgi:KDO2-lipid IV(A) lauroyltransferase
VSDGATALGVRVATRALALLPLRVAQAVGAGAGSLAWYLRTRAARVTRANLEACFREYSADAIDALAHRSLRETGRLLGEAGLVVHAREDHWRRAIVAVVGAERLQPVAGRGTLLLVPHFGNWELLNLYLGREHALVALYEPPRRAALDALVRSVRQRTGSTLAPTTPAGVRTLYRALQSGRVGALLPDQVPARAAGVHAPFFGIPALTMTLAQRIAARTGAQTVLASARRLPDGRFEIRFEDVVMPLDAPSEVAAAALNASIERLVLRDPAQYQWEYARFRRPPPEGARLYSGIGGRRQKNEKPT